MRPVLLVVDVQNDVVADPRLQPPEAVFLSRVRALLQGCRQRGVPVLHGHYITEPDGRGRLPHHVATGRTRCARGTRGAAPADGAEPVAGEPALVKHSYSAFDAPAVEEELARLAPDPLILCGAYEHACIRQTALDALAKPYQVLVAADAVASYDALHAAVTRTFLIDRQVRYLDTFELLEWLDGEHELSRSHSHAPPASIYTAGCVAGRWIRRDEPPLWEQRNPSRWDDVLGHVPSADPDTIDAAVAAAVEAQRAWRSVAPEERVDLVERWAQLLESRSDALVRLLVQEVSKPIKAARGELALLSQSFGALLRCLASESLERDFGSAGSQLARARRRPLGVFAILCTWNNPIFLPATKIAAAIALGNTVVWKPALECPRASIALQESLLEVGAPPGLVNMVFGGGAVAQRLITLPGVAAVTLTGSIATGKQVAATCGSLMKPLQAELGGNNAALVTEHCDLKAVAAEIAHHAFDNAGQSCTATRRLVVPANIEERFVESLEEAARSLVVGEPDDAATDVGPMISRTRQRRMGAIVEQCRDVRGRVFQVDVSSELRRRGCWFPPTIIRDVGEHDPVVQEESFGPILVVQRAQDVDDAIRLCNGVGQGLVGSLYCDHDDVRRRFLERIEVGVVKLNLPTRGIALDAPFGGWKESGLGPPEHGVWNLDAYSRWQAVYVKVP